MIGDGELWVRVSVWLAVLCYPAGPAGRAWAPRLCRIVWTVGLSAFVVHVITSFHVHYRWSQAIALRETARQTAELTGSATGAGLYVNYVFTALWLLDATWWWRNPAGHRARAGWIHGALHVFMLFMVFNGAVVFAHGPVRVLGSISTLAGSVALFLAWRKRP